MRVRNIEFLKDMNEMIKEQISKIDSELEGAKNKKIKGGTLKKQKEKVGSLS